jgi:hypothetical protein
VNPLGLVAGKLWLYAGGAVIVLLGSGLVTQTLRLAASQTEVARLDKKAADVRAASQEIARVASEKYRALEQRRTEEKEQAERELIASERRGAQSLAAERARSQRLSRDIAAFAAGASRPAAADSVPACRADAATLGNLLEGALRAEEDLAAAAEGHADSVRALLAAWPRN